MASKKELIEALEVSEENVKHLNDEILELESELDSFISKALSIRLQLSETDTSNLGIAAATAVVAKIELINELLDEL